MTVHGRSRSDAKRARRTYHAPWAPAGAPPFKHRVNFAGMHAERGGALIAGVARRRESTQTRALSRQKPVIRCQKAADSAPSGRKMASNDARRRARRSSSGTSHQFIASRASEPTLVLGDRKVRSSVAGLSEAGSASPFGTPGPGSMTPATEEVAGIDTWG